MFSRLIRWISYPGFVQPTPGASCSKGDYLNPGLVEMLWTKMFKNFCSDIIQTMKCFALESFNLSCQAEHTKINSRLNFNPGIALIAF